MVYIKEDHNQIFSNDNYNTINNLQANLWTAVKGKDKARNADSIDQK